MPRPRARRPFAEEVRHLLAERGLTVRGLAAEVGVSHGYLVRVLQGKKPLSRRVLEGTARALRLPPNYFWEARVERILEAMLLDEELTMALYDEVELYEQVEAKRGRRRTRGARAPRSR